MIHVESPDNNLSWTKAIGYSDSSKTAALNPNQPVLIASNTKTYVSAAILRLVEDNHLNLDEPIKDLLSRKTHDLLIQDNYDLSEIAIRHLLSHTSGIYDYVNDDYFNMVLEMPQYQWTRDEQIKRSVTIGDPISEPGTSFHYGDINYLLLTEIIETITEKEYYTAIRELLKYESVGLKNTWFKDLETTPTELPSFPHQYADQYKWDSPYINHSWDLYGGGGMASTVKDAALFYQYLFEGLIIEDNRVLREMHTYVLPPEESKYCLGLYHFDFGFHLYYHGGWWGTDVNYSPDNNTSIAVFTLVKDKRAEVNPFLGKKIHEIINGIQQSANGLQAKIDESKEYCQQNALNTEYAILIDMGIHSGKNRLFVVDLKNDSILHSGLCSHGCCQSAWGSDWTADKPEFSNTPESHCSSKGKYRIGQRGYSSWGINVNYKLHGLEASNSKAYDRLIVLHSWDMVPEDELYPKGTPEGWGCPAVSNELMRKIDSLLKKQRKSMLLWIYE